MDVAIYLTGNKEGTTGLMILRVRPTFYIFRWTARVMAFEQCLGSSSSLSVGLSIPDFARSALHPNVINLTGTGLGQHSIYPG